MYLGNIKEEEEGEVTHAKFLPKMVNRERRGRRRSHIRKNLTQNGEPQRYTW